jgi:O-antigen ligase
MAVGLVATWSRGAWLGAGAGLLTLLVLGLRVDRRLVVAGLALVAVLGLIAPTRWPELWAEVQSLASLEANRGRIVIWTTTPRMIADHPVVGTGFGTFVTAYQRYRPPDAPDPEPPFAHNLFLNSAAEMGAVGLLAMVALCAAGLRAAARWVRRCPPGSDARTAALVVLSALVALLASQMVDGTVMSVHVGFGFFALLTLAAVGERGLREPEVAAADAARTARRARETPSVRAR